MEHGFEARRENIRARGETEHERCGRRLQFAIYPSAAEQIRAIKAALLRARSSADAAVRRAEFHRALEIMGARRKIQSPPNSLKNSPRN